MGTSKGTAVIEANGEDKGTWSADATTLNVSIDSSIIILNSRVEAHGQEVPLPTEPVEVLESLTSGSTCECTADTLAVTNDGITSVLNRA